MEDVSAVGKFHFDPSLSGLAIRSPRRRAPAALSELRGRVLGRSPGFTAGFGPRPVLTALLLAEWFKHSEGHEPDLRPNSVPGLLRLNAGILDHLAPLAELDLDEVFQLLG